MIFEVHLRSSTGEGGNSGLICRNSRYDFSNPERLDQKCYLKNYTRNTINRMHQHRPTNILFEKTTIPVVPQEAVAEVSRIGNL